MLGLFLYDPRVDQPSLTDELFKWTIGKLAQMSAGRALGYLVIQETFYADA